MIKILPVLLAVVLTGCATGNTIITGQARPKLDPEAVRILSDPPEKYETIGVITSVGTFRGSVMDNFKARAAKLGANAVILTRNEYTVAHGHQLEGKAILVKQ